MHMHVDEKEILGGGCTPLRALLLSSPSPPHPHTLPPTLGQSLAFHFPSTIHIPKIPTPLFPCWACGPPPRGVAWHPDKEPIANDRKIREWIRPVELGKRPRRRDLGPSDKLRGSGPETPGAAFATSPRMSLLGNSWFGIRTKTHPFRLSPNRTQANKLGQTLRSIIRAKTGKETRRNSIFPTTHTSQSSNTPSPPPVPRTGPPPPPHTRE